MINLLWDNIFKREERSQKISTLLSQNKIFSNLNKKEIGLVEELIHERHYRAGEMIFRQGEIGIGMYILVKGMVDISVMDMDGESPITKLKKGDFFGEISLVGENDKRTATAVAGEDTILLGFFKPDLDVITQSHPTVGIKITLNLAEVIGRRLKATTEKITQLRNEMKMLSEMGKQNENPTTTHKT